MMISKGRSGVAGVLGLLFFAFSLIPSLLRVREEKK
jgi:hypothetical protein